MLGGILALPEPSLNRCRGGWGQGTGGVSEWPFAFE